MSTDNARAPSALTAKIEVWIAGILMVVAFAVGFLVRGVTAEPAAPQPVPQEIGGVPQQVVPAPPLTDQQIQQGLPQGHPTVAPDEAGGGQTGGSNDANKSQDPDKDAG